MEEHHLVNFILDAVGQFDAGCLFQPTDRALDDRQRGGARDTPREIREVGHVEIGGIRQRITIRGDRSLEPRGAFCP